MTKFEEFAKSLEVPGSEGVNWHRFSEVLRGWAQEHRYTHYVPEELLAYWGLTISDDDPNLLNANEL